MSKKTKEQKAVKRPKSNLVTRRVIEGKKVEVYKFENGGIELLDTIVVKRVNEKELAEQYNVEKVMVNILEDVKAVYGLEIETFMELAHKVEYDDSENTEDSNEYTED